MRKNRFRLLTEHIQVLYHQSIRHIIHQIDTLLLQSKSEKGSRGEKLERLIEALDDYLDIEEKVLFPQLKKYDSTPTLNSMIELERTAQHLKMTHLHIKQLIEEQYERKIHERNDETLNLLEALVISAKRLLHVEEHLLFPLIFKEGDTYRNE